MATVPAAPTSATLAATLAVTGWQVQRLSDDLTWSNSLMWLSVLAGLVATVCVLGWTWVITDNACRLIEPASRVIIPDPAGAVRTWIAPFVFVAVAVGVILALLLAVMAWTFLTVINVRRTSGRRFDPLFAAVCWPAAAVAVWWIADRMIVGAWVGSVVPGLAAQAAALALPLLVLERVADAVGARRSPFRIMYVLGVVLLVHVQGLGGLMHLPDSATTTEIGRLAGYLAIGALIRVCSALAVTEACHALSRTCRHEADDHNMLVGARRAAVRRGVQPPAEAMAS